MLIRDATEADIPAILDIFNQVVETSTAIYFMQPVDLADRLHWFRDRSTAGLPVLVYEGTDGLVLGYGSFGPWRGAWAGYRFTVEHSVYVRVDQRGRGIGRKLLEALIDAARTKGMHVMIGCIDADNQASIDLHAKLGFAQAGYFREVGHKFDRWLDLVMMQLNLE